MAESPPKESVQFEEEAQALQELSDNIKKDMMSMMLDMLERFQVLASQCSQMCSERCQVLCQDMLNAEAKRRSGKQCTHYYSLDDNSQEISDVGRTEFESMYDNLDITQGPHHIDKALPTASTDEHNAAEQVLTDEGDDRCGYIKLPSTTGHNISSPFAAKLSSVQRATKRSRKKRGPLEKYFSTIARVADLVKAVANEQQRHKETVEVMYEILKAIQDPSSAKPIAPMHAADPHPPPPAATTTLAPMNNVASPPLPVATPTAPVITVPPPLSVPEQPSSIGTRDSSQSELVAPTTFQVGDKVECFSISQKRWSNADVKIVKENFIIVQYEQVDAQGNRMMKALPWDHHHLRHTNTSIAAHRDRPEAMADSWNSADPHLPPPAATTTAPMSIAASPPLHAATSTAPVITMAPPSSVPELPSSIGTRDTSLSELVACKAFQVGDKVECFSISQKRWSNAVVQIVKENLIIVQYEQIDAKGNRMMKALPWDHRHLRRTNTSVAAHRDRPGAMADSWNSADPHPPPLAATTTKTTTITTTAPMSIAASSPLPAATTTAPVIINASPPSVPEQPSSIGTRDSSPSELVAPRAFQVGDKVECFSISQKRWSNADVKIVKEHLIIVQYEQVDARGNRMMKALPWDHHHLRRTNTSIAAHRDRPGAMAESFNSADPHPPPPAATTAPPMSIAASPPLPAATSTAPVITIAPPPSVPEQPTPIVTRDSSPSDRVVPRAFQVGDKVECFSISQKKWSNAVVKIVKGNDIIVEYEQVDAKGNRMIKALPWDQRHLRHTNTSIAAHRDNPGAMADSWNSVDPHPPPPAATTTTTTTTTTTAPMSIAASPPLPAATSAAPVITTAPPPSVSARAIQAHQIL